MRAQIASQPDAWWGAQTGREREDGGVSDSLIRPGLVSKILGVWIL